MTRLDLERRQVWIYLAAILAGLGLGLLLPGAAADVEAALWPLLGILIFVTFTQVRLIHLPEAFRDRRFMGAMLAGNFGVVPLIVAGLLVFLPADPAVRLGVLLVLLVPCTDWYITFTHLAGGDTGRAIAATPVNLIVQMGLLPVYLWLFMGSAFLEIFAVGPIVTVFQTLIAAPLVAAWLLERWAEARSGRDAVIDRLAWFPVPLLAIVVFLISASQVQTVTSSLPVLPQVAGVFVGFLVLALLAGLGLARAFRLPPRAGRALVFSLGTRNSFVVLPLALALSTEWQLAIVVIVFQSLVELLGVLVYLKAVPRLLPDR
ncbi:arsenic resistance protein [Maliponia aquimaris]|uniref:Sodium Bile acid symporter family protein n=1 Tax=Maliponia aquimaris TaxID=1673631 RepID=A0A238KSN9_9RHOB|nr:bile acid:sodium symporter [Maliponia aquimaris]SMX45835.1 Sodium Bile acid symporter family protein [Maliponia aquimaris]